MMRAIHRKLLREIWHLRWQGLAICVVMACGVAMVVMSLSTLESLERTRSKFYQQYRFPDIFVHLKRAPNAVAARLAELPGVADVETRVDAGVTLDVPGLAEPASARLISIPDFDAARLCRLHVRQGRLPEPGRSGEVVVSEAFAEANSLVPGDSVRAVINGRLKQLEITGVVLSPEYIYSVRAGELLPDDRHFGVFWMGYHELSAAFDLDEAFNDAILTVVPGSSEADVIRLVDDLLDPYGGTGAHGRSDQSSYKFLDNEMVQLRAMASLPPVIFLSVTAFLLQVVLSRLIATQREQIATLRAFGYTQQEIGLHFLMFAAVLTCIGTAAGLALGVRFGYDVTELYVRFFRFPEFRYWLDPQVALLAIGVSGLASFLGVWSAVWRAAALPPAQAMQPEAPAHYHASLLERLGGGRFLSPAARMVWRGIERHPTRTIFSSIGISLAIGILILGNYTEDIVDFLMDFQFGRLQKQDVSVTLVEPASKRALSELAHMPGVRSVEAFRAVPVRLRFGARVRRLAIMGLDDSARLFHPLDDRERPVSLPPEGLVISKKLAEVLGCRLGDYAQLEVLEGERPRRPVPIAGIIADFVDLNAYMRLEALHRLMHEQDAVSGAFLAVDADRTDELYGQLKRTPHVAGVTVKRFAVESYRQTIAENLLRMKTINVLFAAAVAFGVVYNCARISLAERSRELATLRVLGFTRAETSLILLGELTIIVLVAIPLGWLLGYWFAGILTRSLNTEVHRFPLIVSEATLAFATLTTVLAAGFSALVVRRRLDHLDLVAVLKARD